MKKSITKNFIYSMLLNIMNLVVPILITPFIFKKLGPESIGEVEFTYSLAKYFLIIATFGTLTYGLRELSKVKDNKKQSNLVFSEIYSIKILMTLLCTATYYVYVYIQFREKETYGLFLILGGLIISNLFNIEWVNRAYENFKFIAIKTIIIRLIYIILIVLLIKDKNSKQLYLSLIVINEMLNYIVSYIYIFKNNISYRVKDVKISNLKYHFKLLLVIVLMINANVLYTQFDKIMLGFYSTKNEVAYYSIGQKVMGISYTIVMTMVSVSVPRLSYYLANEKEKYYKLLNKLIEFLSLLVIPMSIGIIGLSKEIILFFGGTQYLEADLSIKYFGFRLVVAGAAGILNGQILFLHKKEKIIFKFLVISGILNVILKFSLIRFENLNSSTAILTTIIAEIFCISLYYSYIIKKLKISLNRYKAIRTYVVISFAFIPTIYFIKQFSFQYILTIIFSIIVCIVIYTIGLLMAKDKSFLEIIKIINRKFKRR
ncbi:oligosaccharide flippase family protein [Psychrilyobacter atlanticus]|uniref:oligosaccharide flippase family protein n=1 Tax=Psychrilyobacter atlanticus TaxID=271091 RepID=UPI00048FDB3E|nr:oligosaccharide flippase family protein [Psychrilyobacter atlanticus]